MRGCPRVVPILLDPPQFERTGHNFKLRATIRAKDNLAFLDIVFLEIEAVLTFGTQKFVPVGKSAGSPSHDYFSFPAEGTQARVPCLRTHADPTQVVQLLYFTAATWPKNGLAQLYNYFVLNNL